MQMSTARSWNRMSVRKTRAENRSAISRAMRSKVSLFTVAPDRV